LEISEVENQVKAIEEFLIELTYKALPPLDYIERGLKIIEENFGRISVGNLSKEVGISRRQFDRKFQEVVGVTPKYYSKITQLYYVITQMSSKKYSSIQDLAFNADFYDLPHFAHRFKELTGFTPNEFINSDKHIAMKYFLDPLD
jgi:AraC-like DNA-binding protein